MLFVTMIHNLCSYVHTSRANINLECFVRCFASTRARKVRRGNSECGAILYFLTIIFPAFKRSSKAILIYSYL